MKNASAYIALAVLLSALKLAGVADISWTLALMPVWLPLAILLAVVVVFALIALIAVVAVVREFFKNF